MAENSTVSCYDGHSNLYDAYQSAVVPHYQDMLDIVAATCQRYLRAKPEIIDLGCGTGNASLAVLDKTQAKIFLIDGSVSMVEIAREKIDKEMPGAVRGYKVADLGNDDWHSGLEEGSYDAIVSTLVLEHLPFDRYRNVIDECRKLLRPGGWLIAVEGYDDGEGMLEWFNQQMDDNKKRLDPRLAEFVAQLRDQKEVHYYSSKAQKEALWRDAGFENVHVIWQYLCLALMAGRKPGVGKSTNR
ncbi:MAG TPA: class I SAM-dependent methyltransferase [Methanotrichaceae archaeon]|nr:class I SAM-dependent methyltransferase [Methanotrichaceae archaeon]